MKKFLGMFIVCFALVSFVGCEKPTYRSLNLQRSAIRGTADVGTTVSFESIPREDVVDVVLTTLQIAEEMHKFLNTGMIGQMTMSEVKTGLGKIASDEYVFLVDLAIMQLSSYSMPIGEIGVNNVKRVDSFIVGVIVACNEYKLTDRPEKEVANKSRSNKSAVQLFAKAMRQNHKK